MKNIINIIKYVFSIRCNLINSFKREYLLGKGWLEVDKFDSKTYKFTKKEFYIHKKLFKEEYQYEMALWSSPLSLNKAFTFEITNMEPKTFMEYSEFEWGRKL